MTNDITPEEKLISKKATFHKNCLVHITFNNGAWENGTIIEVGADFLILNFLNEIARRRWNCSQRPFFFMEIKNIEGYEVGK